MYLLDILIIMIITGLIGGAVNYLSDSNKVTETSKFKRSLLECLFLGFAATIMIPFFLKLADSSLLQDINIKNEKNGSYSVFCKENLALPFAQNYLLWSAYCLLGAAAGMRFIELLISKVLTQAEKQELQEKVQEKVKADKKKIENLLATEHLMTSTSNSENQIVTKSVEAGFQRSIGPIKYPSDPQKGRFGGKSKDNGRTLSVEYSDSRIKDFLNLIITVSADNPNHPFEGDLYLYLHDSFAKSLIKIEADGKEKVSYEIPSYGAFTIGASADDGRTLLELDLSELKSFPEYFRNR